MRKLLILTCASLLLGGCSTIGDRIDEECEQGTLTTTQNYLDTLNDHLAARDRKFRIDGITCL